MNIAFTFRNLDPSEALKQRTSDKLEKLQKFAHAPMQVDVTLSVDGHRHFADVGITTGGQSYHGRAESEDMYASVDMVVDKLRQQMQRAKGVLTQHRKRAASSASAGPTELE